MPRVKKLDSFSKIVQYTYMLTIKSHPVKEARKAKFIYTTA